MPHLHNSRLAALQPHIAALYPTISIPLWNISYTVRAAAQLDINIAVH
jgi:hypothetical protein